LPVIQTLLVVVLFLILPGYLVLAALFPRRGHFHAHYDVLYRIGGGMALSIILFVVVGFLLNEIPRDPATGLGYFRTAYIWAAMLLLDLALGAVGWRRGGLPMLGRLHPRLRREIPPTISAGYLAKNQKILQELEDLARLKESIKKDIEESERKAHLGSPKMKQHYDRKKKKRLDELDAVVRRMEDLELERIELPKEV